MKLKLLCLGVAAFFLGACSGEPVKETGKREGEKEKPTVTATVKSLTEFEDVLATHKGKVVVVDLWAMWWSHCVEGLPHLVQLQEKNKDVVCISLNLDHKDPDSPPAQTLKDDVVKLLKEKNITCENVIMSDGIEEALAHYEFSNGLPAILIYGRDGELRMSQDAGFEYETEIEPKVKELLAE